MGEVGPAGVSIGSRWTSGSLITRFCVWCLLRGLCGSCFLERLAFSSILGLVTRPAVIEREDGKSYDLMCAEQGPSGGTGRKYYDYYYLLVR